MSNDLFMTDVPLDVRFSTNLAEALNRPLMEMSQNYYGTIALDIWKRCYQAVIIHCSP